MAISLARYCSSTFFFTVRVLICDLTAGYEVQGITETLLTCTGYENASTLVVAEFLGTGVLASREVRAVGRSDLAGMFEPLLAICRVCPASGRL